MSNVTLAHPVATKPYSIILSESWGWRDSDGEYQDLPDGVMFCLGEAETLWEAALMQESKLDEMRREHPGMWIAVVNSEEGNRVLESLWTGDSYGYDC